MKKLALVVFAMVLLSLTACRKKTCPAYSQVEVEAETSIS